MAIREREIVFALGSPCLYLSHFEGGDPSKPKGAQHHEAQRRTRSCRAFRFVENLLKIEFQTRVLFYSMLNYGIPHYKFRKHNCLRSKIQAKEIMRGWFGFSLPKLFNVTTEIESLPHTQKCRESRAKFSQFVDILSLNVLRNYIPLHSTTTVGYKCIVPSSKPKKRYVSRRWRSWRSAKVAIR